MQRDMKTIVIETCAIDVGYSNVKYTSGRVEVGGNVEICTGHFPALAPVVPSVGLQAAPGSKGADGTLVTLGGTRYFAGRGVKFHVSGTDPRTVPVNYCETDEYMALLRGALHYIAQDVGARQTLVIEQLVLGLPLTTFRKYRDAMPARFEGDHVLASIGGAERLIVHVKKVLVVVQPMGALYQLGSSTASMASSGWTLVVDAGGGTLDWFVSQDLQPNWTRAGAHSRSMLACCYAVADRLNPNWKNSYEVIKRIDEALRTGADSFVVGGEEFMIAHYRPSIEAVLRESVNIMMASVKQTDDLDHILLTGGGAALFGDFLAENYPHLKRLLREDPDCLYANVKGFHLMGEVQRRVGH